MADPNAKSEGEGEEPLGDRDAMFLSALRWMILARTFEEKVAAIYRAGKIVGGVYVGRGQEAFSAALAVHLIPGKDVYAPLIRDMAGRAAFGEPPLAAARTYLGSEKGPMRGRDGNIHRGDPRGGVPAMISHLGAMLSVASGMLFARRLKGTLGDAIGAACIGDGATSTGAMHEALNFASVEHLPLVVAIANNQFAYSTPNTRQFACPELADRAKAYGIPSQTIDATDLRACLDAFGAAVGRARSGGGPQMVVGNLLRLSGHGEHDDAHYVPDSARRGPFGGDCVAKAKQHALDHHLLDAGGLAAIESDAARESDAAIAKADAENGPDPYRHDWRALATARLHAGDGPDA